MVGVVQSLATLKFLPASAQASIEPSCLLAQLFTSSFFIIS